MLPDKAGLGRFEVMESMLASSGNDRAVNAQNSLFGFTTEFCSKDVIDL